MTETMTDAVRVSVAEPADVPGALWEAGWSGHLIALHPRRVRETLGAPGWRHSLVLATCDGTVAGVMPVSRPVGTEFPAAVFDPRVRVPDLPARRSARDYLLIGGHFDLASGCAVRSGLPDRQARRVRRAVARAAFALARRDGLAGVALYVPDAEGAEWEDGLGAYTRHQSAEFASIDLAEPTRAAYLAALRHSRRSVVIRDERELDRLGLRARAVAPGDVLEQAVPLVAAVKEKHGAAEHPRLVEYRLDRWSQGGAGTAVAFALHDQAGVLLAVSFGRCHGDTVEMYEIGLQPDGPSRRLAYAEVLVYAPLRFAFDHGCTRLRLGCDSTHPKQLRGAKISPMWAITATLPAPDGVQLIRVPQSNTRTPW